AMLEQARRNLSGIPVDLRCGTIRRTDYVTDCFDLITSTGSFYLWDEPVECLNEIFRILKPGKTAFIFESYQDYDRADFLLALRRNLELETPLRRLLTPGLLKRQLRMTYTSVAVNEILCRTHFAGSFLVEKIVLGGLPAWLRIGLKKP
ncbi:MAG: class I SAM-dependent methyltransferase, partial [Chloroflexi bacterium]|nr:class I SAM-dependent methyltransferase [Chloroflexota bacterium]